MGIRLDREFYIVLTFIMLLTLVGPALAASTTSVHVIKYANDGTTILNETTVDFQWMEANLPVYGDGSTHYYHQGPVFNASITDPWNPEENDPAILTKDMGAVKGTDLKDLCDLVGGMSPDDFNVTLKASDGFSKCFAYSSVYSPPARAGPIVLCWYNGGDGYVDESYSDGIRNVMMADTSSNPWGYHVFGLWDMHETYPEAFWYYYQPGQPSTTGLSVRNIDRVLIYSNDAPGPSVDTLFDGTVTLDPDSSFTIIPYNNLTAEYSVQDTTPLGALNGAAGITGFDYNVSDKSYWSKGILLLDEIGGYWYDKSAGKTWICQVNGVTLDDYGSPATDGFNLMPLLDGDQVDFYFGVKPVTPENATAVVKILVETGSTPGDWSINLNGKTNRTITRDQFEEALACVPSGHNVTWTDSEGSVWGGIPLWILVGMVDDDESGAHWTFNDALAAEGYTVKVKADDWDTSLASADIARDNGFIVANTLNGTPLPLTTPGGKPSWPLHLKGSKVFGGQQVGGISAIELVGLPEPPSGWTLTMEGAITDVITQSEFEQGIACHHNVTYTDSGGSVWGGVPLWDLVGTVDDIESSSHWTFNDTLAAEGYTVRVIAGDGFNVTFPSQNVSHENGFILANTLNGSAITGTSASLKLVGPATTSGKQRVGNVTSIRLEGLPSYPPGDYQLTLNGKIGAVIPEGELEDWIACHGVDYTDPNGAVYHGIPLWRLCGWVDDRVPHNFDDAAAAAGYKVIVKAGDGYSKEFQSASISRSDNFIIANTINGSPLSTDGAHPPWPLRLVGAGATGGNSVGNIVEIELTDFQTPVDAQPVHIIKYGPDGVTVINETTVSYAWMEEYLPVIGDGTTVYQFEAITSNPADLWDAGETYPGGFKISNAVKGTRLRDLCDLVGGMGGGTDIRLIASDGYETTLPYSSIYTNPAVQARQGDAVLCWYADGDYVPYYGDGMRVFFMPDDHVYGQWDMHETLPDTYWHYYFDQGVQYPSCAGLSAKWITTIRIYSSPESDWTLELNGTQIGGLHYSVSKNYFEQALACQFGSNHDASYTDSKGRVWDGMPLWFLCGFVDDADQHSNNAFNDTLAAEGYLVRVTARDGTNATFDSMDVARNSGFLVANSLNGTIFADSDSNWPLRLTGSDVPSSSSIKGIAAIDLLPVEHPVPDPGALNVPLGTGWNIFSTPIALDAGNSTLERIFQDADPISIILVWDGTQWIIPSGQDSLVPLYAIFVKTTSPVNATLIPSTALTSPQSRVLLPGINLVGPAPAYTSGIFPAMPLDQAFASIAQAEGGRTGYIMVISPGLNQPGWVFTQGMPVRDVLPFKGYWVVMENQDTLWGFSTSPIDNG